MTGRRIYNNVMGWDFVDNKPSNWGHTQHKYWKRMIRAAKRAERRNAKKEILLEVE